MPIGSNNTTEDSTASAPAGSTPTPRTSHSRRNAVLRAVGLIGVVIAWLAIAGIGGPAIGSLSTVQSND
jgi:RND superfamily putative drug exporter